MISLSEHIALARIKVLQEHPHPQQPDWSLDQDVQRYSRQVGEIHRLMELAERDAVVSYQSLITPSRRTKKDPK